MHAGCSFPRWSLVAILHVAAVERQLCSKCIRGGQEMPLLGGDLALQGLHSTKTALSEHVSKYVHIDDLRGVPVKSCAGRFAYSNLSARGFSRSWGKYPDCWRLIDGLYAGRRCQPQDMLIRPTMDDTRSQRLETDISNDKS